MEKNQENKKNVNPEVNNEANVPEEQSAQQKVEKVSFWKRQEVRDFGRKAGKVTVTVLEGIGFACRAAITLLGAAAVGLMIKESLSHSGSDDLVADISESTTDVVDEAVEALENIETVDF